MKKRNSYTVQFSNSSFGQIEFYAVVPGKDELLYVAFVLPLVSVPSSGLHLDVYTNVITQSIVIPGAIVTPYSGEVHTLMASG